MTYLTTGASGFAWGSLPLHADAVEAPAWTQPQDITDFPLNTPDDDPDHCYPGMRPTGSFVVFDSRVLPVRPSRTDSGWQVLADDTNGVPDDLDDWLDSHGQVPISQRLACVGYGSNLNPNQVQGFGEGTAVVVLRALTVGLATAFCNKTRWDKQFPAGVVAADPARAEDHGIVLLDPHQLDTLDDKEGQGSCYTRTGISRSGPPLACVLENGTAISGALPLYLQDSARPVALENGQPVLFTDVRQADFGTVAKADETHEHGLDTSWIAGLPPLDAEPLPVFAYGTLQPGQRFWDYIAEFVDRTEPASITGHRLETDLGYPGLQLDHPDATTIPGTLLHPRPDAIHEAMQEFDRIEGHPGLYARHLVRVDDGRLAWTYLWND
jgi:gamma-glutamylcyclotransferase (GGCT)/AIG2-like uncharacterized protein YtfP